jgi:PAS domain S-box-containing protein
MMTPSESTLSSREAGPGPGTTEDRFRIVFEQSDLHLGVLSPEGSVLEINRTALAFGGAEPDEIVGLRLWDAPWWAVSAEERARLRDGIARAARGEAVRYEGEVKGVRGDTATLDVSLRPVLDSSGTVTLIILEGRDIGRRKLMEEELRRSEQRFRLVARATTEVIREWDLATGDVFWCDDAARTFRYPSAEISSRIEWWYERIHPRDRESVVAAVEQASRGAEEVWSSEYGFLRGDGTYAIVLDRGLTVRDSSGAPVRMVASMMDVTERRRSEMAQRFLAQASSLLSSSRDPRSTFGTIARLAVPPIADFCVIDLVEGDALRGAGWAHVDPVAETLLQAITRPPIAQLNRGDPRSRAIHKLQPVLVARCSDSHLAAMSATPDDHLQLKELAPRSLMVLPLFSRDEPLGIMVFGTSQSLRQYGPGDLLIGEDIARRIQLSLENARLNDQAQAAVRAREDVLAMVSHDLRNPLGTIMMTAELLGDAGSERRQDHRHLVDIVRRSAAGMQEMIEDLLDLSALDGGAFGVELRPASIADVLEFSREALLPLAEEKSLHLEIKLEPDLPPVRIDEGQILRVLSNLLGNAVKFTPAGGRVRLSARRAGADLRIEVTDTGPGLPPEDLPHVFDRYWKSQRTDRRGAGLGLAIARGIVEAHGGSIGVESTPGSGSSFHFILPCAS